MASIVVAGDTSGSVTIAAPAIAGTPTLTLPTATGTILTTTSPKAGNVIQVVSATYGTQLTNSTNSYQDTGLTASITPSSASSKILVLVNQSGINKQTTNTGVDLRLLRGAAEQLIVFALAAGATATTAENGVGSCSISFLDSPNTTYASRNNTALAIVQHNNCTSTITLLEIAA
jgi:hypothetical protein